MSLNEIPTLIKLYRKLENEYYIYRQGHISEKEYLDRIRPIDQAIDKLEMATLQDSPVLKGSSSLLFQ